MSLRSFESIARAYDGLPTDSSIRFVDGISRERVAMGVTRPRAMRTATNFMPLTNGDHGSDLVGIWRVMQSDGIESYHILHSDTRAGSGISVNRLAVSEAVAVEQGLKLPGAFEHQDIILGADGLVSIGDLALEPMVDIDQLQMQ